MTFDPTTANLAVRATLATVGSARPDAPVVAERPARTRRTVAARSQVAARLHGLARWVEPAQRHSCQPG
ncbi:hypothetical protein [Nocardioides sp. URHA0020]|uniref:hypothetical protein n=1 Tax=Nocardioides sp. URHA0020 TaxID=1380392 RepID=UPI000490B873|nr:hypothetical protein [Nocardioides sp. URHA0020]